jgi:glycosyltransferase involved in cell wall biosynthesis
MYRAMSDPSADAILMTGHNLAAQSMLPMIKAKRKVLVLHYHHTGVHHPVAWRLIFKVAYEAFDAICFASEFIRSEALKLFPRLESKSSILRDPYSVPDLPSPEARIFNRKALGVEEDQLMIGNAGWLIERKRLDVFLKVCAEIKKRIPRIVVTIAGDGPLRPSLECLARDLGLGEQIRWLGWRNNLLSFYSSLDLLLFNSDWDALGRTPVEAIASGTPVVASVRRGGVKEILPAKYADIIDTHDISRLADLCVSVLTEREAARQRALEGRSSLTAYSPEADGDRLEDLLFPA